MYMSDTHRPITKVERMKAHNVIKLYGAGRPNTIKTMNGKLARLPHVPGAGFIKPLPNHVANNVDGCFRDVLEGSGLSEIMLYVPQ
jgi:hypothetical protein